MASISFEDLASQKSATRFSTERTHILLHRESSSPATIQLTKDKPQSTRSSMAYNNLSCFLHPFISMPDICVQCRDIVAQAMLNNEMAGTSDNPNSVYPDPQGVTDWTPHAQVPPQPLQPHPIFSAPVATTMVHSHGDLAAAHLRTTSAFAPVADWKSFNQDIGSVYSEELALEPSERENPPKKLRESTRPKLQLSKRQYNRRKKTNTEIKDQTIADLEVRLAKMQEQRFERERQETETEQVTAKDQTIADLEVRLARMQEQRFARERQERDRQLAQQKAEAERKAKEQDRKIAALQAQLKQEEDLIKHEEALDRPVASSPVQEEPSTTPTNLRRSPRLHSPESEPEHVLPPPPTVLRQPAMQRPRRGGAVPQMLSRSAAAAASSSHQTTTLASPPNLRRSPRRHSPESTPEAEPAPVIDAPPAPIKKRTRSRPSPPPLQTTWASRMPQRIFPQANTSLQPAKAKAKATAPPPDPSSPSWYSFEERARVAAAEWAKVLSPTGGPREFSPTELMDPEQTIVVHYVPEEWGFGEGLVVSPGRPREYTPPPKRMTVAEQRRARERAANEAANPYGENHDLYDASPVQRPIHREPEKRKRQVEYVDDGAEDEDPKPWTPKKRVRTESPENEKETRKSPRLRGPSIPARKDSEGSQTRKSPRSRGRSSPTRKDSEGSQTRKSPRTRTPSTRYRY